MGICSVLISDIFTKNKNSSLSVFEIYLTGSGVKTREKIYSDGSGDGNLGKTGGNTGEGKGDVFVLGGN